MPNWESKRPLYLAHDSLTPCSPRASTASGRAERRERVCVKLGRGADTARRTTIRRGARWGYNLCVDHIRSCAKGRVACVSAMVLLVVRTIIAVAEPDAVVLYMRVSSEIRRTA